MAISVKHRYVSAIPDSGDASVVEPSNWNDTHIISGQNERTPAQAGSVPILATDIEVGIDTSGGAVTVVLPSAAAWAAANPFGNDLVISDRTGNAGANNITPTLNGADTFRGGATGILISAAYGLLRLRPANSPVTGWIVRGLN